MQKIGAISVFFKTKDVFLPSENDEREFKYLLRQGYKSYLIIYIYITIFTIQ